MNRPRLRTALVTRGHTAALKDGTVRLRHADVDFEDVPAIVTAFRRMVRGLEFDVSEMALTTYLCARAFDKPFTALPIFPWRAFHHGAIVHNTRAGISHPRDLEGRRVGVNRGYTVTTGVWARGILQHEYGVDLGRVTWVLSGDEHVAEFQPPPNVVPLEPGRTLAELLVSGEIPAAIGVQVDSPEVQPLLAAPREASFAAFREHGLYPINHTLVVKDACLQGNPGLAVDLFEAFVEAKRLYLRRLEADAIVAPSADDVVYRRVMEMGSDPLPYGIAPNRRMIERLVRHAHEQGIIPRRFEVEELFPASTHGLAG